jgi:hypothetical protein
MTVAFAARIGHTETAKVWFNSPKNDDLWVGEKKIEIKLQGIQQEKIRSVEI